ncbi:hypothetical protein B0O99DRAFT_684982 [Bisporella sp. PMI_857]|nr:hypothetical protein B0O99DRAFT_684982 [Bisporella sp. PMI_857]
MLSVLYIRIYGSEEAAGAFIAAINATLILAIISLSRQALSQYPEQSSRDGVQKGTYIFEEGNNADVTVIGKKKKKKKKPVIVIEAYVVDGWERYADAEFSMLTFGKSLPSQGTYDFFRFTVSNIAPKVKELVDEVKRDGIESFRGDFRDLNRTLSVGFYPQ